MSTLINGKQLAETIKEEIAQEVKKLERKPHLVAILVGDDKASETYVRNKVRACEKVGFQSTVLRLDVDITETQLLEHIHNCNEDPNIDGFIVQLPLPKQMNEERIMIAINHKKDVDGFHPTNFGRMAQGMKAYIPATPNGILLMLERYNIQTSGKHCVVVGRSNIVGTPISLLLSRKTKIGNATVTLAHSRTQNLTNLIQQADILIAAIGIPFFITSDMIKQNAVVIDVGINQIEDKSKKRGYRLVGDVDFENVKSKTSFITPVPGGVGPMTVTSLLLNTLKAYKKEVYS